MTSVAVLEAEEGPVASMAEVSGPGIAGLLFGDDGMPYFKRFGLAPVALVGATVAYVNAHINDTADAHDASAISFVPGGTVAATDTQTAVLEVASDAATALAGEAAARAAADLLLIPLTQKGAPNGVAPLGADSKIATAFLPPLAINETFTVTSQAAMLALTAERGDLAIRTELDPDGFFLLTSDSPSTLADWKQILAPGAVVTVEGRTGAVTLSDLYINEGQAAGGVLSGTLPNPGFAVDMATQAELDTAVSTAITTAEAFSVQRGNHTGTQAPSTILTAATARFLGRITAAGGPAEELTGTQATTLLDLVTTTLKGLMSSGDKVKLNDVWKDAVTDGGCSNTGASDCTAAVQALINSLTGGGIVFFPVGVYRFDSTLNVNQTGVTLLGQSRAQTKLCTSHATADFINITSPSSFVRNLRVSTIVAGTPDNVALRTAGFGITMTSTATQSGVLEVDMLFQWSHIQSSGGLQFVDDANLREYGNNAPNGQIILINGPGDRYLHRIVTDNGTNPTGFAGIRVTDCASLEMSDCNIIHAGTCLALEPANGKTVPSIEAVNCFFDSSVKGMAITPAGTGSCYRSKFTGCWFGSHTTAGVEMNGAQWDGITFDNCDFYGSPIGISCPSGGGKWMVCNSRFAGATTAAISVTAGAAHHPKIIANDIGPQAAFGVNAVGIIVGAGAYKGLQIQENSVVNNTSPLTLGAVTVGATEAGFFRITDNAGINPRGAVTTPAVAASTAATTNTTGFRVTVYIKNGSTGPTAVTVNGVVITAFVSLVATTGFTAVQLDPGGTITFTYTVVPTWIWVAN